MKAAPCSWCVGMTGSEDDHIDFMTSAFSSPGTPKMYLTPSASRHRRKRSLDFIGECPPPLPILAGNAPGSGRAGGGGHHATDRVGSALAACVQLERDRVHAVPLTGRVRSVVEDVAQGAPAPPATGHA